MGGAVAAIADDYTATFFNPVDNYTIDGEILLGGIYLNASFEGGPAAGLPGSVIREWYIQRERG